MHYTDNFQYEPGIDFVIVNFYREEYVELLIESIHKYTKGEYSIYLINNGNNTGENNDYDKLKEFYKSDKTVTVLKGEEQKNEVRPEDGAIFKCKIDGRMVSLASKMKTEAQQQAWRVGNRELICSLDYDAIFLDEWVDDVVPLLGKGKHQNLFVSYIRWDIKLPRDQFMLIRRQDVEEYNLYPNLDYKDGSGNIIYWADNNNRGYFALMDSNTDKSLKEYHLLNLPNGEQLFINDTMRPFFFHYARGASRDSELYRMWIKEARNYLDEH